MARALAQGARSIVAKEGMGGLYSGLLPTLLRDVPEIAIQVSRESVGPAEAVLVVYAELYMPGRDNRVAMYCQRVAYMEAR